MEIDAEEKEISLFDLLVVVAENLKLLIFVPVVVGLLTLGFSYTLQRSFTSQAILVLPASTPLTPAQSAAMMVSPKVLDAVVELLMLSGGQPLEVASVALSNQIKVLVGRDGLLRIDVTANTPLEAQTRANAVIDVWLKSTAAGGQDRADLEQRLVLAKNFLESVHRFLSSLTAETSANLNKPLTRGDSGISIVAVGELQARYLNDVLIIPRQIKGLSRDIVVQPPTLPTQPVAPKKSLMAVLAALGSGIALLLLIFMRQAWKNALQDPKAAEKLAKLLATVGFKKPTSLSSRVIQSQGGLKGEVHTGNPAGGR